MTMINPPHPAGLITEYLDDHQISLARHIGVSPSALSKVATGRTAISPEMALWPEAGSGIAARLWLAMQAIYDLNRAREWVDLSGVKLLSPADKPPA